MKTFLLDYLLVVLLIQLTNCGKFIPVEPSNITYSQGSSILRSSPAVISRLRELINKRGIKIPFLDKIVNSSISETNSTTDTIIGKSLKDGSILLPCTSQQNQGCNIHSKVHNNRIHNSATLADANAPLDRQPRLALFLRKLRRWSNYQPEPGTNQGRRLDEQWQEFKKWRKKKRRRRQLRRKILKEVFKELGLGDKDLLADILGTSSIDTSEPIQNVGGGRKMKRRRNRQQRRLRRKRRNRRRNRHMVKSIDGGEDNISNSDLVKGLDSGVDHSDNVFNDDSVKIMHNISSNHNLVKSIDSSEEYANDKLMTNIDEKKQHYDSVEDTSVAESL